MMSRLSKTWLWSGYAFLYLPILWLVVFSFNGGQLASLWGGFSLRWYRETVHDAEIIDGLLCSLKIAFLSASASVVLGTLAGWVMARYTRFKGRSLFIAHINAPLVVPEVITGVSLLLFFVSTQKLFGLPGERGLFTIWVGHTSIFASYAAVIIHSRLSALDRSIEEAAMDLGARPLQVFFLVVLPMISQALMSAWLLTFTLSLDDVVSTAFLSGPGTTTLPIVIFSRMRLGLKPSVNVVATLTVAVVAAGIVFATLWMARRERLRNRVEPVGA
ncbi:MAG: ABC transporter permease subunit [Burkholderiaceae bacterium]|nr:ABC transporter permease subunit [Burkholderiaceae bacterium]